MRAAVRAWLLGLAASASSASVAAVADDAVAAHGGTGVVTALDSVAAVIERRVVTLSEVSIEARLVLFERGGVDVALGPVDERLRAAVLETMVAQELLALEARRAGVVVRETEIDGALHQQRARFDSEDAARAFWARLGADEELLRARARRDLSADVMLKRAWAEIRVPAIDVARFLEQHPEHGTIERARAVLEQREKERVVAEALRRARTDADVRIILVAPEASGP